MPYLIAQEGPLKGLVLDLEEGEEWVVGRDPDEADLLTDDHTVSRKHLRITKKDEEFFLKNLSRTNPTLVNDEPIQPNTPLKEGDKIRVGDNLFIFSDESAPISEVPEKKGKDPSGGYDDIFGDLEEPELPPEPEPLETTPPSEPLGLSVEKEPAKTAYDTIFEDLDVESEMPFNLLAESPLVLKVIGGPNAGAEIGLEKGRSYLLGKDSNSCDIVFQDLSVSRSHARLSISENGIIELEDLGSKNSTIVNGSPLTEKQIVTSQDLIAMGTTVFLIIDREAAQETIYSPILPAYESARTAERGAAALVEEEIVAAAEVEASDWKQEKIPGKHLVFAGAAAAVFLIVFLSFFSLFKSENIEIAEKLPHDALKEALANYPGVHYAFNPASQKLFLAGHVMTSVDYQELLFNLGQLPEITISENNIVIDEGVAKSMNDVLNAHTGWQGVAIMPSEPGRFIAYGYVKTSAEAGQIDEYLTVNFPYVDLLQNQIVVEDLLYMQIASMLRSGGFGALTAQMTNGNLLLGGTYPATHEAELNQLITEINKLHGVHSVRNFAVAASGQYISGDLSQQYAVTGTSMHDDRGYSAVINGRIYTLGQSLNGMEIISIQSNEILLEKDGLKYRISYNR